MILLREKIRVLHCVGYMKKAGAETFIMNMYRNIERSRVQFDFLCCEKKKGDYDEEINELGGRIFYLDKEKKSKGKINKYLCRIKNYFKAFKKQRDVDVVHIHGHHAFDIWLIVLAARLAGVRKVIVHSHNAYAESHIMLHKFCKILLLIMNTRQLACSQMAAKWMFLNSKYSIIPNGIFIDDFTFNNEDRNKYRKEFALEGNFVIGHIGRFEEQKNHTFLVKVFNEFQKKIPNSKLLLIGEGPLKKEIYKLIEELGIGEKVVFAGVRHDVSKIYSAMDSFVFPSFFEGLGIVAIEAETSDLPCLFSDSLPPDIDIINKVLRCSLNASVQTWVDSLEECYKIANTTTRQNNYKIIARHGYNIEDCCNKLFEIYSEL